MAIAFRWAGLLTAVLILAGEVWRWSDPNRQLFALFGILAGEQPDWLPFAPWFVALPLLWWRWPLPGTIVRSLNESVRRSSWLAGLATLLVGGIAFLVSYNSQQEFVRDGRIFPPAYHDEYSYWLQAETFLQSRTWLPLPGPRAELYDQMHVLNEGRFASRYFPGVGLWLLPFVACENPWLAQQTAHAVCAMLVFWIGRDLRDNWGGFVAGLLFALSPGLTIFSTLLLAHHPTLVGLLLFTWAFLRLKRNLEQSDIERQIGRWSAVGLYAVLAGSGLAFAMLCRPMTAAGVGLPFGLWFGWWLLTSRAAIRVRLRLATALTVPLLAAIGGLLWYSSAITGDSLLSPYQQYTDIYTPRHVYGFNNVQRGEQHLGPKVIDNYDRWAENLTLALSVRNVGTRLIASLRMTLGVVPLLFSLALLVLARRLQGNVLLLAAAIVSLHLVHIPYWYAGIMDWHYVLESAPYWLLLCGVATSDLAAWSRGVGVRWPRLWWGGVLGTAVAVNTVTLPLATTPDGEWLLWRGRIPAMIPELRFARGLYSHVANEIEQLRGDSPAVVLVLPDPTDRSLDFVTNRPSQWETVLRVRVPSDEQTPEGLRHIAGLFPQRRPLVLNATSHEVRLLK
ncbi:MAG: hypothetical protein ACK5Q5_03560 [Planctomycetaceae bacterium]